MNSPAVTQIPKIDYTTTPHPSGVKALSLKDAPALIETLLPVQKLSIDVYKERTAGSGQTLTALGSYWKGRKPLVLNRACVLASLLPATDDPIKDLEVFELLMGMDDVSLSKRVGLAIPARFEVDAPSYAALRRQLTESGIIAQTVSGWAFTKDQFFSSGSAAAAVVRASNSNADWWKGSAGKNLGDYIREAKAKA